MVRGAGSEKQPAAPQDSGPVKKVLAKNWNWIVLTKNRYLGSGTLKNRK